MNLAIILVLMLSCLIARISLTVRQAIRWLKAIHAPRFGALRDDLWWTSASISVGEMRTKRSRSIDVSCAARVVLSKSHTVMRRLILNNLRNCAVPPSTSAFSLVLPSRLRAPLTESIRSKRPLDFTVITASELPLSPERRFFRRQKNFLLVCLSFPRRKFSRDAK